MCEILNLFLFHWFQSISRKKKLFVHFVLDPIVVGYATAEASFAARYGCLVVVDKVSIYSLTNIKVVILNDIKKSHFSFSNM